MKHIKKRNSIYWTAISPEASNSAQENAVLLQPRGDRRMERTMSNHIQVLRDIMAKRNGALLPGAPNALAARIIADLGFEAIYLTGAGLTNMSMGLPDLGFMDLTQVVD